MVFLTVDPTGDPRRTVDPPDDGIRDGGSLDPRREIQAIYDIQPKDGPLDPGGSDWIHRQKNHAPNDSGSIRGGVHVLPPSSPKLIKS